MSETLPLSSVKTHLSELVGRVENQGSLEEALAILSEPAAMEQVRESEQAIADGDSGTSLADLQAQLARQCDAAA